jgi:AraC family transcriptional regulator
VRPIAAQSRTFRSAILPIAYDWVKFIFVRDGAAILISEFGEQPVTVGDVVVLAANTLCGSEPEGSIIATTLYLECDYIIDQVFWQHSTLLTDRFDAQQFADELYSEPAQILPLGVSRCIRLTPWLDELVALSAEGRPVKSFYRMQALWFSIADVIAPFIQTSPVRRSSAQRTTAGDGSRCACTGARPCCTGPRRADVRSRACPQPHLWSAIRRTCRQCTAEHQKRNESNHPGHRDMRQDASRWPM